MAITIERAREPSCSLASWRRVVHGCGTRSLRGMRSTLTALLVLCLPALLAACGGGSKADAPATVQAVAGDQSVTLSWAQQSDVEYWVFYAPDPSISPENFVTVTGSKVLRNVNSPLTITGLTNGTTYYFTINGRTKSGPGGPGTPVVAATPRPAGAVWSVNTPLAATSLNGVIYGAAVGYVTVGTAGTIFSSPSGTAWTAQTSRASADLNAVDYLNGTFVAVGANGMTLRSTDAVTWTAATASVQTLNAITARGAQHVAVGNSGTIVTSGDGATWTVQASGVTADLRGVAFGGTTYVVVGDNGVVLTSTDAVTWARQNAGTQANLRAIAYGAGRFVAVGDQGTIVASTDGATWGPASNPTSDRLNAIAAGTQLVAVGAGGRIITSLDGLTWTTVTSGTTATLNAVASTGVSYVAVGVGGVDLVSF